MKKYNKYINNFANNAEYEEYINGSIVEVPNTALIDDTGEIKMTKYLPNNYVMFGTTTGTQDFMIGENSIQIHVVVEDDSGVNKMYVASEDLLKTVTSLGSVFNTTEGKKIISIKKWKIDTSNVASLYSMFHSCKSLTYLDLSNFITSNVTNMSFMFYYCGSLKSLDLSSFDSSKVTAMSFMFYDCRSLTSLDLSSFDTSIVTDITYMFSGCSNINKLYLSSSFFNSTSLNTYDFSDLFGWTDTESLAMFVEAITEHECTGKTVKLSSDTKNALTTEQKTAITNAGWTIS